MRQVRPDNPAKTYLSRYRALAKQQESLRRAIEEAYMRACNVTQQIKAVNVQGGGAKDKIAEDVARIADAAEQLREMKGRVDVALSEILDAIQAVPDEMQRSVLLLRYVEGLDWISIADRIGYEISQTYIYHGRALWTVKRWLEDAAKTS